MYRFAISLLIEIKIFLFYLNGDQPSPSTPPPLPHRAGKGKLNWWFPSHHPKVAE